MTDAPEAKPVRFPIKCLVPLGVALGTGLAMGLVCAKVILQIEGEQTPANHLFALLLVYVILEAIRATSKWAEGRKSIAWLLMWTLLAAALIARLFGSPAQLPLAIAAIAAGVVVLVWDVVPNTAKTLSQTFARDEKDESTA